LFFGRTGAGAFAFAPLLADRLGKGCIADVALIERTGVHIESR
jgi:hypothetical protein